MSKVMLYMVYDSEKDNERIGSFTPEDANKLLGITPDYISTYASAGTKYKGRYIFIPEQHKPIRNGIDDEMLRDWDFTTAALKTMAGGGKHGK